MIKRHHMSGRTCNKSNFSKLRKIKVGSSYYPQPLKTDVYKRYRTIPSIHLKGFWLKQAGFSINTPIDVHVMHECIVITVDHDRPMPKPEMSNDMEYRYLFIDGLPVEEQAPILTRLDQWIKQYQARQS